MFDQLREDINCVFERDPAARSRLEILTAYPGIHAILIHRVSHQFWQMGWYWFARFMSHIARWMTGIEIHPGATIGRRFFIDHGMGVVIGETAIIGDDCTLYHGVTLGGTSWQKGKRHPTLGNDVVVGAGAKVLGPIEIGDNVRIGSNSVVVKPVPPNSTVVGIPGKLIERKKAEPETKTAHRHRLAKKIGFDAYGATQDMPDPVAHAINCMLDHMHVLDRRVEAMCETLREQGQTPLEDELPDINNCEIISTLDELNKIRQQNPTTDGVENEPTPNVNN